MPYIITIIWQVISRLIWECFRNAINIFFLISLISTNSSAFFRNNRLRKFFYYFVFRFTVRLKIKSNIYYTSRNETLIREIRKFHSLQFLQIFKFLNNFTIEVPVEEKYVARAVSVFMVSCAFQHLRCTASCRNNSLDCKHSQDPEYINI